MSRNKSFSRPHPPLTAFILGLLVIGWTSAVAPTASAEITTPDTGPTVILEADQTCLERFLTGNGVADDVATRLVDELGEGRVWDSLIKGKQPVRSQSHWVRFRCFQLIPGEQDEL